MALWLGGSTALGGWESSLCLSLSLSPYLPKSLTRFHHCLLFVVKWGRGGGRESFVASTSGDSRSRVFVTSAQLLSLRIPYWNFLQRSAQLTMLPICILDGGPGEGFQTGFAGVTKEPLNRPFLNWLFNFSRGFSG